MKKLKTVIVSLSLLSSTISLAQDVKRVVPDMPVSADSKLITYSKVVTAAGESPSELYKRAINWVTLFYKNPSDVLREKDSVSGKIVCKHRFKIVNEADKKTGFVKDAGLVQYTLNLQFKEGRYKYELTEINWKQLSYYPIERWMDSKAAGYAKEYEYYLVQTDETANKILADLEKGMNVPSVKPKKEEW